MCQPNEHSFHTSLVITFNKECHHTYWKWKTVVSQTLQLKCAFLLKRILYFWKKKAKQTKTPSKYNPDKALLKGFSTHSPKYFYWLYEYFHYYRKNMYIWILIVKSFYDISLFLTLSQEFSKTIMAKLPIRCLTVQVFVLFCSSPNTETSNIGKTWILTRILSKQGTNIMPRRSVPNYFSV